MITAATSAEAAVLTEDFSPDPAARGWEVFGERKLFEWDSAAHNLAVTWDSTRPNSYFRIPFSTVLDRQDDFSIAFDLRLDDVAAGIVAGKPSTFPLAIGLQNTAQASRPEFSRGAGSHSPNLVEFNFFPDTGFGPTIWPAIWSTNSLLTYNGAADYTIIDLPSGIWMRITMSYTAADTMLATTITTNGVPMALLNAVTLSRAFTDFRVDAFSVSSYSDAGQDSRFGGSLLAHGIVDNIMLTLPPPPVLNLRGHFRGPVWEVLFDGRPNWSYVLEAAEDFISWNEVSTIVNGTMGEVALKESQIATATARFYRVKARRLP